MNKKKTVKCVKDEDHAVLLRDEKIKERWKDYFDRLCNGSFIQDLGDLISQYENMNRSFMRRIKEPEVKEILKNMKSRKPMDPDEISIEVWSYKGGIGVRWLIDLLNKI